MPPLPPPLVNGLSFTYPSALHPEPHSSPASVHGLGEVRGHELVALAHNDNGRNEEIGVRNNFVG